MKSFLLALQFLTIIPLQIKNVQTKSIGRSMISFPIIGVLIGAIAAGINTFLLSRAIPVFSADVISIISIIVLTGALHMDGLADTLDALLSVKGKDKMLEIMHDPHIGAMGVCAIISVIFIKIALLYAITENMQAQSLITMCVVSRWILVFSMAFFPYARTEGKAKLFIENSNLKILILSFLLCLIPVVYLFRVKGLFLILLALISAHIFNSFVKNKIGGITGDTLGAVSEITEVVILSGILMIGG